MKLWMMFILAAALLTMSGSAFAVPSLGGPTGIVVMPSAMTAATDEWQIAVGARSFAVAGMYDAGDESIWSFGGLKGVSDDAELFVLYQRESGISNTDIWEYGGKYVISEGLFARTGFLSGTKIAVGASLGRWGEAAGLAEDELLDVSTLRAYLVATKQFLPAEAGDWTWGKTTGTRVIGSGGLMYLSVDADEAGSDNLVRPFLGVEIIGKSELTIAGEYRFKDSDWDEDAVFSAMIRKPWGTATALEIGITNASPIGLGTGDQSMYARFTYALPTAAYQ